MSRSRAGPISASLVLGALFVAHSGATSVSPAVLAGTGVGGASWTPDRSETVGVSSSFLVADDSILYATRITWSREQVSGLSRYIDQGLRYTHEVNDRSGRLSATGYWATNLPDPAFDRDDDDGDGRWEEAEITAGAQLPRAGLTYKALLEFSRWHPVERRRRCDWAWDLRAGQVEILSQLSREILGEWQALRYTLAYERLSYPRSAPRPPLPLDVPTPDCGPAGSAVSSTDGLVVTFTRPLGWEELLGIGGSPGSWSAFEAIGERDADRLTWTCGGPVQGRSGLEACRAMGVTPDGVVAAGGHFSAETAEQVRRHPLVLRASDWREPLPTWLAELAGIAVEPPDLTLDDDYWSLVLGKGALDPVVG